MSFTTTHIVETREEAMKAGEEAALMTQAFRMGYATADLEDE